MFHREYISENGLTSSFHEVGMVIISTVGKGVYADTTAGHEYASDFDIFRVHEREEVVEDNIYAVFMEIAVVSETEEI